MSLINQHKRKQSISDLMSLARDHELLGHDSHQYLCRYIAIRLIVYLDKSLQDILSEYCIKRDTSEPIKKVVSTYISGQARNLECSRIIKVLEGIDSAWAHEFRELCTEEGSEFSESKLPSQLASLKGLRDRLAHNDETTVRLSTLDNYYESTNEVIKHVKKVVLGI